MRVIKKQASLCLILVAGALSSCQTVPKPINPRLPAVLEDAFDTCGAADGELQLRAKTGGAQQFTSSLEWLAKSPINWEMEIFNQLGLTLLRVKYAGEPDTFTLSGQLASRLPPLATNSDRFLTVDGYFVPLRVSEIPCLLKIKMPRVWRDNVVAMKESQGNLEMKVWDSERDVTITARNLSSLPNAQVCVRLAWTRFLGMVRRELQICESLGKPFTARLRGIDNVEIDWTKTDGA